MAWYEATLDWLTKNVPWQIMFGVFVASGVLLFFATPFGIDAWAKPYRGLEVTFFVFSGAVLAANVITSICRPIGLGVRGDRATSRQKIPSSPQRSREEAL
jgi:hypothetical protein